MKQAIDKSRIIDKIKKIDMLDWVLCAVVTLHTVIFSSLPIGVSLYMIFDMCNGTCEVTIGMLLITLLISFAMLIVALCLRGFLDLLGVNDEKSDTSILVFLFSLYSLFEIFWLIKYFPKLFCVIVVVLYLLRLLEDKVNKIT